MGFIVFGTKTANIGVDELLVRCPSCEADCFADVLIRSNYFHVYFLPLFPYEKEADVICQTCKLKRLNVPFNRKHFINFQEFQIQHKHPFYTYSIVVVFAILIALAIITSIVKK